ncbi:MAG: phage portal protein [Myxococcota bacterium]
MSVINLELRGNRDLSYNTFSYPGSEDEWRDWYIARHDAYVNENYTLQQIQQLQLFQALDPDDKIIAQARRLGRDIQHVVDTGTGALAGSRLTLQLIDRALGNEEGRIRLEEAQRVWRRSHLQRNKGRYARILCSMGDLYIEPVRQRGAPPFDTRLVWYEPYTVTPIYDDEGLELVEAIITQVFYEPDVVNAYGVAQRVGRNDRLVRRLTRDEIIVELNGEPVLDESGRPVGGKHNLGRVPMVHIPCIPYCEPGHSLWVGHGLDRTLAEVDSLLSQASAVGDRYANPHLVIQGADVKDRAEFARFGRVIEIKGANAKDAKVYHVEITARGLKALLESAFSQLEQVRRTLPEYLYAGAGANASGVALRFLATRFETKYEPIRDNFWGGLALATEMAVSMDRNEAHNADEQYLQIAGPPLLPADVQAELAQLQAATRMGAVSEVDLVRHVQRLGIADAEMSAEDYAEALRAERQAHQAAMAAPNRGEE